VIRRTCSSFQKYRNIGKEGSVDFQISSSQVCLLFFLNSGNFTREPSHTLVCLKKRLKWGCPSDEIGKTKVQSHSSGDTIKIPPCSKALSAEHRPKFCSPSLLTVMMTSEVNTS
jgi:hypothetical protein